MFRNVVITNQRVLFMTRSGFPSQYILCSVIEARNNFINIGEIDRHWLNFFNMFVKESKIHLINDNVKLYFSLLF
jgi:hypothetical protein